MKAFLSVLLLLSSSLSFADTPITGFVTRSPSDYGQFQIQEKDSGQTIVVDVHIRPGPVCGQVISFARAMGQAVGHEALLTGIFENSAAGEVFMTNSDGIQILEN